MVLPFPAGRSKPSHKGTEHTIANTSTAGAQSFAILFDRFHLPFLVAIQLNHYQGHKGRSLVRPFIPWPYYFLNRCFPYLPPLNSLDFPLH